MKIQGIFFQIPFFSFILFETSPESFVEMKGDFVALTSVRVSFLFLHFKCNGNVSKRKDFNGVDLLHPRINIVGPGQVERNMTWILLYLC